MSDISVIFRSFRAYQQKGTKHALPHNPEHTYSGQKIDVSVSCMMWYIRRNDSKNARLWAAQLDMVGLGETVWNILTRMCFTDVGLLVPLSSICLSRLCRRWYLALAATKIKDPVKVYKTRSLLPHESWRSLECKKLMLTAVAYLCHLPKNQMVKNCNSVTILTNKGGLHPTADWSIKFGTHRTLSKLLKPVTCQHNASVKKAVTCLHRALLVRDEWNAVRIADLLSEWGHTQVGWDMVERICFKGQHHRIDNAEYFAFFQQYVLHYQAMWYYVTGYSNAYSIVQKTSSPTKGYDFISEHDFVWPGKFEVDSFAPKQKQIDAPLYSDSVPKEWKIRHDQNVGIVAARPIWMQTILLIVRGADSQYLSNLANQGDVPSSCRIQEHSEVRKFYNPEISIDVVPDPCYNMFTQEGRDKLRGVMHYNLNAKKGFKQSNNYFQMQDDYDQMAYQLYQQEEYAHGNKEISDFDIIQRRTHSSILNMGREETNPLKQTSSSDKERRADKSEKITERHYRDVGHSARSASTASIGEDSTDEHHVSPPNTCMLCHRYSIGISSIQEAEDHREQMKEASQKFQERVNLENGYTLLKETEQVKDSVKIFNPACFNFVPLNKDNTDNKHLQIYHANNKQIVIGPFDLNKATINKVSAWIDYRLLNQEELQKETISEKMLHVIRSIKSHQVDVIEDERITSFYKDNNRPLVSVPMYFVRRDTQFSFDEWRSDSYIRNAVTEGEYNKGPIWVYSQDKPVTAFYDPVNNHASSVAELDMLTVIVYNLLRWVKREPPVIGSNRFSRDVSTSSTEILSFVPGHMHSDESFEAPEQQEYLQDLENDTTCDKYKIMKLEQQKWLIDKICDILHKYNLGLYRLLKFWNRLSYQESDGYTHQNKRKRDSLSVESSSRYQMIQILRKNIYTVFHRCSSLNNQRFGRFGKENALAFSHWLVSKGFMRLEPNIDFWLSPAKLGI